MIAVGTAAGLCGLGLSLFHFSARSTLESNEYTAAEHRSLVRDANWSAAGTAIALGVSTLTLSAGIAWLLKD